MKLPDEMLKAYYDSELDLVARAEIGAAIARDPGLARIAENHCTARDSGWQPQVQPVPGK